MANQIRLKRASGSDPSASDLVTGELAVRTDTAKLFTKKDNNSIAEIGGGITALVSDTSPQLGGDLDTNSFEILLDDSHSVKFGDGADFQIYHDGSHNRIDSANGNIYLRHGTDNAILTQPNGSVSLYYDDSKKFETTSGGAEVTGNFGVNSGSIFVNTDNQKIFVGASQDLEIYHDGSNSYVAETGTGNLILSGSAGVYIKKFSHDETMAAFLHDAEVQLYHNNVLKFQTTSAGVEIHGNLQMDDNKVAYFGTSGDMELFHDGSSSFIRDVGTGSLKITSNGTGIDLQKGSSEFLARFIIDGPVELYYDNVKTFFTKQNGIVVQGTEGAGATLELRGDEGDDNSDYFRFAGHGSYFYAQNYASGSWETNVAYIANGAVELYFNNIKEFETTNGGVKANGYSESIVSALSYSGSNLTPDFAVANNFSITLSQNSSLQAPANQHVGQSGSIFITQDGTGSRTLNYSSNYKFAGGTAPTLSTAANAVDRIDYIVLSSTKVHSVFTADVK